MKKINIIEVGPRDGFQSVKSQMTTEYKIRTINELIACGIRSLQIGSFVSPKAFPQMADTQQVCRAIVEQYKGELNLDIFAMVPNLRGAENAAECGIKHISAVISLYENHNLSNVRRTHDESFAELAQMRTQFPELEIELDIPTAFGNKEQGKLTDLNALTAFISRALDNGAQSFTLCDTIGIADPRLVRQVSAVLHNEFPGIRFSVHIHDNRGMGIVNSLAAIETGICNVQTSLCGLGGIPGMPGVAGNTATEDLVYMLTQMGYDTGIDIEKLLPLAHEKYAGMPNENYSGHQIHIQ